MRISATFHYGNIASEIHRCPIVCMINSSGPYVHTHFSTTRLSISDDIGPSCKSALSFSVVILPTLDVARDFLSHHVQ